MGYSEVKPDYSKLEYFLVSKPGDFVAHVEINRPKKFNSFIESMWLEFGRVFDTLSNDPDVRAIILSGAGEKAFTTGLDVQFAAKEFAARTGDAAREARNGINGAEIFQKCIGAAEKCSKPVICVMHGYSLGLAIDIACCTDIRICAKDTMFAVKEVDIGMAADIGTLSRLPKLVGSFGWCKDVCLTARSFGPEEAYRQGFVSYVEDDKAAALKKATEIAVLLAEKSPVAVWGTKEILNRGRDQTIEDSLRYTGVWTAAMQQTADMKVAMLSGIQKRKPTFEKL